MSSIYEHLHPGFVGERPEDWDNSAKQDFALPVLAACARGNNLSIPPDRVHIGTWYQKPAQRNTTRSIGPPITPPTL